MFRITDRLPRVLAVGALAACITACSNEATAPAMRDPGSPSKLVVSSLSPALIIDTGPGGTSPGPSIAAAEPPDFPIFQFLAGQITLPYESDITSVGGWMKVFSGGNVIVRIRANTGDLPGTSLYSQTYTKSASDYGWVTFENFNVSLAAGTYWVTFEPPTGEDFIASMPNGAQNPLPAYAFFFNFSTVWLQNFGSTPPTMGFQVSGILGPAQAISDLEASIDTYQIARGTATSLNSKLELALSAFGVNDLASACVYLQDAINYTRAQSGKRIPTATANSIISDVTAIRNDLGC